MNKAYNRINWENYPSDSTPLNENNLNKMDVAINEVDNRVISLDTTKLPVATAYTMVKDVAFDEKTGVFTITKLNGSVIKIDTALEKISTNFRFDYSTQKLILTLIDGTTQEVDLSAVLSQYEFTDSDTIAFTIDTSGKVVASVKKGSITQDMLEPNYLANIRVEVAKAESASLLAETSETNAKTSEENAKASEEAAETSATNASVSETNAKASEEAAETSATNASVSETNAKASEEAAATSATGAFSSATTATNKASAASTSATNAANSATNAKASEEAAATSATNAKTSEEKAREYAEAAGGIDTLISSFATGTNPTIQDSTNAPLIYGKFKGYTLQDGEPTPDNPIEINGLAKDGAIKVKTCGKNLYNTEDRIAGVITNDGVINTGKSSYTHTPIRVLPNTVYTVSRNDGNNLGGGYYAYAFYTKQHEFITVITGLNSSIQTFKTPANCYYVYLNDNIETDKKYQLEVGDTATPYEPYTETTTAITIGTPLYEGDYIEIYADGSGKLVRKMKEVVFDGSDDELWKLESSVYFYITIATAKGTNLSKVYSTHFIYNEEVSEGIIRFGRTNNILIMRPLASQNISTVEEFKAWLAENNTKVVYELAEPTETPLTAEQVAQFKQLYTFEPVTNVFCDGEVELLYYKNTDNGETVGIVHKKVEASEKAINSVNDYYSSLKKTFDTVVGGTVSNNTSNVEYTKPSFLGGSIIQMINKGGTLVNGLKDATAKIAETLSSMCDFFIGKIAYNIGGKEIIEDFDYENWIAEKSEAVEGTVEYPTDTLERFERLIAQCVEASIKLNDSLNSNGTILSATESTTEIICDTLESISNYLFLTLHVNWYSSVMGALTIPTHIFKANPYNFLVYGNNDSQFVRFSYIDDTHVKISSSAENVRGGITGLIKI